MEPACAARPHGDMDVRPNRLLKKDAGASFFSSLSSSVVTQDTVGGLQGVELDLRIAIVKASA